MQVKNLNLLFRIEQMQVLNGNLQINKKWNFKEFQLMIKKKKIRVEQNNQKKSMGKMNLRISSLKLQAQDNKVYSFYWKHHGKELKFINFLMFMSKSNL